MRYLKLPSSSVSTVNGEVAVEKPISFSARTEQWYRVAGLSPRIITLVPSSTATDSTIESSVEAKAPFEVEEEEEEEAETAEEEEGEDENIPLAPVGPPVEI